jgi:hypothetical protein
MFQSHLLNSQNSVTIQLMFLPYYVESVEVTLDLVTSVGNLKYHVHGNAVPNPYRLHPFLGHRVPIGTASYDQPIVIFNPHTEPLHIREIFTTEDFLSLRSNPPQHGRISNAAGSTLQNEIRTNVDESDEFAGQNSMWVVAPGVQKDLIILSMAAKSPGTFKT